MKKVLLLVAAVLAVGRTYAEVPCANVYIFNATFGHASPADILAKADIEELVSRWPGLCFKGYVSSGLEWQVQNHPKNDVLLSYTLGTLDEGNGVGAVGKKIEAVTYDVYAWDSKLNHIVNSGPDVAWFAVTRDSQLLQMWAKGAANAVAYVVALMAHDGREAK